MFKWFIIINMFASAFLPPNNYFAVFICDVNTFTQARHNNANFFFQTHIVELIKSLTNFAWKNDGRKEYKVK